jgi:para-aminobenzoate synthetase / 4-amino-4-deoxychorismate lyase
MCCNGRVTNPPKEKAIPNPPAEWPRIAAAQAGSVILRTARQDADNRRSYFFTDALQILATDQLNEIPGIFESAEKALRAGHYVAGFVSYEAGYHFEPAAMRPAGDMEGCSVPLVWFGIYREPLSWDECGGRFPATVRSEDAEAAPGEISVSISRAEYGERIQQIRRYIEAGDLYQANFTVMVRHPCHEDAGALFERMMENQPVPYGALIHTGETHILSASPELFFRKRGSRILVRPMKGTARRGRDREEDGQRAAWLAADEKNRAENVMIVDLLRNDLGRICRTGSIEVTDLFAVERYPGLLQMTSTVQGELKAETNYHEIFRSLFPCGSITGAPKVRTMQVIRALEGEPRGVACGAIGFISPCGDAVFSVAIRSLTLGDGEWRMRVGSGVTYDSDAETEYAECLLKVKFMTRSPLQFDLVETMAWAEDFFLLDLHLERMEASADYFGFRFERESVREQLYNFAKGLQRGLRHRVRLLLARSGVASISSEPIPAVRKPASLLVSGERTDSFEALLRHKTTRRSMYDRVLADARARGFDDALFLNERGEVTECAIHNVMIAKGGKLVTPPVECGLLPGVYRRYMLAAHPEVQEAVVTLDDILSAGRILIFNSVRGLRLARILERDKDQQLRC